jgi:hypothetical protein
MQEGLHDNVLWCCGGAKNQIAGGARSEAQRTTSFVRRMTVGINAVKIIVANRAMVALSNERKKKRLY